MCPFLCCMMGHRLQIASSEAGGITQGIGAYKVLVPIDGKLQPCVFLDTPGHEVHSLTNYNLKLAFLPVRNTSGLVYNITQFLFLLTNMSFVEGWFAFARFYGLCYQHVVLSALVGIRSNESSWGKGDGHCYHRSGC